MEYKITMPILSDTMDKGKIIKWYVKPGDKVKKGDKLCEVESDKATMDIESFYDGIVKEILAKEGDEVEVKSTIAIIENGELRIENENKETLQITNDFSEDKKTDVEKTNIDELISSILNSPTESKKPGGTASPAAKKEATISGLDIEKLQNEGKLPIPAHLGDIQELKIKKYFTPKAYKLIKEYELDINEFELNRKIRSAEVLNLIKQKNIPKKTPLNPNQKAVIKNLQNSTAKPTFFVFEEIEIKKTEGIKLTAKIIKALALAMQKHPLTRSILNNDTLLTYPASNISVAVARDDGLFMCVIKNAQDKSLNEINDWLKEIKTKKLTIEDLSGSTFGISNLGMFEIESFTALINGKDTGIAAFGVERNRKIKVTFTIDHRILNGVDAAKFINDFKKECKNV
jgi:pyruvate dehydrogenase E2 component (dihydrolipoamide acetyltransferase)